MVEGDADRLLDVTLRNIEGYLEYVGKVGCYVERDRLGKGSDIVPLV